MDDYDANEWAIYHQHAVESQIAHQVAVLHECVHGYVIGDINELEARELLTSVQINPDDLHKLVHEYKESKQYALDTTESEES